LNYKIGHIALAFLLLLSSSGIVLNLHYCQNELKSSAFFVKAQPCHENKALRSCPMHGPSQSQDDQSTKGCCEDQSNYLKSEIDQFIATADFQLSIPTFLSIPPEEQLNDYSSLDCIPPGYLHYKPPQRIWNYPVRFQNFRC